MGIEKQQDVVAALDRIFSPVDCSDAPGLVVGISLHGTPMYRRGFGLASVRHGVANTPATRVRIASTSKQFTCLAILLLAEDGKLDIDAPADRYLGPLPGPQGVPTLRQFMGHTSGYRCSLEMGTVANGSAAQPLQWQVAATRRQTAVHFAPNQGQMYCNGTYVLLAEVIDRVSGMPFEAFLRTRIFEPLGMHDTESVADNTLMVPGSASLHVPAEGGGWRSAPADAPLRGDGGVVSTVDDMLRWMAHLNGTKRVGTAATWKTMPSPNILDDGFVSTYLMGLKRTDYRGVTVVHHSGGLYGLNSQMLTVPRHGLDIMIMVNGAPVSSSQLAAQVVDAMLPDELGPAVSKPSVENYRHLVGTRYADEGGFAIAFDDVGGVLSLSMSNMPPAPVLRDDGTTLGLLFEDVGLGPYEWAKSALAATDEGSAPTQLDVRVAGEHRTMIQLATSEQSILWSDLVGSYRSLDLDADATITATESGAELRIRGDYSGWRSFAMEPWSATVFGIADTQSGGDRYVLTFDGPSASVDGFWIDAFRARRLRFDRVAHAVEAS